MELTSVHNHAQYIIASIGTKKTAMVNANLMARCYFTREMEPALPLDASALQQEIRQANEILQQLALPWDALFQAVEATSEQEIALLSIQPDVGKRIVRIGGEAKNFDALLAYITRLEDSKILNRVYLTSHEVRTQVAEKPVRFALVANWVVQP